MKQVLPYFVPITLMSFSLTRWIKISLFNLLILSVIGMTLRYKIAFSLSFIDQKHLLHGHSHFAFAGWITQAIMTLMVARLNPAVKERRIRKYNQLLLANLVTAYGMLVCFPIEGYGFFSILFSTASIIVSYIFAFCYWKDLNSMRDADVSHSWFKAALLSNAFSSLGAFALAIMMTAKIIHQNWYLAAEYFYLHFEYNGWFFFACMGLFMAGFGKFLNQQVSKNVFRLFAVALVPAYFLSALWMHIPTWVYTLVILAAIAQVQGWVLLTIEIRKQFQVICSSLSSAGRWLLGLASLALTIKLLLQLGSTIPALSTLAYGFRPIVIGYLHLVLLGVITLYLLGDMCLMGFIRLNQKTRKGIFIFACGIVLNEVLLMIQGIAALGYLNIPYINESLLTTAMIMFCGILILNLDSEK